jgi:hypothetical protein
VPDSYPNTEVGRVSVLWQLETVLSFAKLETSAPPEAALPTLDIQASSRTRDPHASHQATIGPRISAQIPHTLATNPQVSEASCSSAQNRGPSRGVGLSGRARLLRRHHSSVASPDDPVDMLCTQVYIFPVAPEEYPIREARAQLAEVVNRAADEAPCILQLCRNTDRRCLNRRQTIGEHHD